MNGSEKKGSIIIVTLFIILALIILIPMAVFRYRGKSRIMKADHKELLEGCRQIIANYDAFTNEWSITTALLAGEKGLEVSPGDRRIPASIQWIEPTSIAVASNYVRITPSSPPRVAIIAYLKEEDEAYKPCEGKWVKLTNCLWYCDYSGGL